MRKATSFLVALLAASALPTPRAPAQTLTVLYSFSGGTDGAQPAAGLVMDKAGNLYGTTTIGGCLRCVPGGFGTVFKLDTSGTETVLHSFTDVPDGAVPYAGLVMDKAGNLYGTTPFGGYSASNGTVFKLDASGTETVLHSFTDVPDGVNPYAGLVMDKAGNLYGTTYYGGLYGGGSGFGMVFKVGTSGNETVLHRFAYSDGAYPYAGLVMDKAGNLYGTAQIGGSSGSGTVFKLTPGGTYGVLYNFTNIPDGAGPLASLVMDEAGNLYGTTTIGGSSGFGTVFKVDSSGNETVLHSFTDVPDGAYPYAALIVDKRGNLYGTTRTGGASGYGTVYKVDSSGDETVLHSFTNSDGAFPIAGLIRDKTGNLYATTSNGGAFGYGTVFKLVP